jgi:ubiquinone/menaquinone biosynthesis C-methylase UbiE
MIVIGNDDHAMSARQVRFFTSVATDVGYHLASDATVLDFGCGEGKAVAAWRDEGYRAFGCDVVLEGTSDTLRLIETPYRLPFDDAEFDLIVSDEVLEHVQDYGAAFAELRRVLKPDGLSVHLFPARWVFLEPHAFVPLATVIQSYWWLAAWARLGVRNRFQQGEPWRLVATRNRDFLRDQTNYPSNRALIEECRRWFPGATFETALAIKHGNRTRRFYPLVQKLPVIARAYQLLRARLLILR